MPGGLATEPQPEVTSNLSEDETAPVSEPSAITPSETEVLPETQSGVAPAETDLEVPAGSEFTKALPETDPEVPGATDGPTSDASPIAPAPGSSPALPDADTTTATEPDAEMAVPEAPAAPDADDVAAPLATLDEVPKVGTETAPVATEPDAEAVPGDVDLPPPPPLTPEEEALVETAPEPEANAEVATLQPDAPLPGIGEGAEGDSGPLVEPARPATGFSGEVDGVKTDRLPRIGDAPAETDEETIQLDASAAQPVERFAARFENPEGKPVFSIILIDAGDPALDRATLAAMPFPVTFALDPTLPNVADLAAIYRDAGKEVVMLASSIPAGATASDLEVTFEAHGAALPEAVAVLDIAEAGMQGDRMLATQVVAIVKSQGRGLLTYDAGLNAADQVASRDGVRSATIFRRLDAEGEQSSTIRRYLDRAAFRAAQEGRVVVIGEARPETVSALMEWAVEGRASAVALAPVTAAMVAR